MGSKLGEGGTFHFTIPKDGHGERSVKESGSPHEYTVASLVAEAKTMLNSTRFDAVIADCLLEDGTVFDIFEMGVDAPITVITGAGDGGAAVRARGAGAYDYLVKDPDNNYLTVLPTTVANAVKRWNVSLTVSDDGAGLPSGFDIDTTGSLGLASLQRFLQKTSCREISRSSARNGRRF